MAKVLSLGFGLERGKERGRGNGRDREIEEKK